VEEEDEMEREDERGMAMAKRPDLNELNISPPLQKPGFSYFLPNQIRALPGPEIRQDDSH
jgi:hypothetical protein